MLQPDSNWLYKCSSNVTVSTDSLVLQQLSKLHIPPGWFCTPTFEEDRLQDRLSCVLWVFYLCKFSDSHTGKLQNATQNSSVKGWCSLSRACRSVAVEVKDLITLLPSRSWVKTPALPSSESKGIRRRYSTKVYVEAIVRNYTNDPPRNGTERRGWSEDRSCLLKP